MGMQENYNKIKKALNDQAKVVQSLENINQGLRNEIEFLKERHKNAVMVANMAKKSMQDSITENNKIKEEWAQEITLLKKENIAFRTLDYNQEIANLKRRIKELEEQLDFLYSEMN